MVTLSQPPNSRRLLAARLKENAVRLGMESEMVPVDHLHLEKARKVGTVVCSA